MFLEQKTVRRHKVTGSSSETGSVTPSLTSLSRSPLNSSRQKSRKVNKVCYSTGSAFCSAISMEEGSSILGNS